MKIAFSVTIIVEKFWKNDLEIQVIPSKITNFNRYLPGYLLSRRV